MGLSNTGFCIRRSILLAAHAEIPSPIMKSAIMCVDHSMEASRSPVAKLTEMKRMLMGAG